MIKYTHYPEVNKVLNYLYINLNKILKDKFIGMYIHGSLALRDFQPNRSDIDLVIVTRGCLSKKYLDLLRVMHNDLTKSKLEFAKRIECIYIPEDSLVNNLINNFRFPCLHVGGDFFEDWFGVIETHVLREYGIVIKGKKPKEFIEKVDSDILKKAVLDALLNWWKPMIKDNSRLKEGEYQVYAVLTMCRVIYSLENGDMVSKTKAYRYAKSIIDKKWVFLLEKAINWKIGDKFPYFYETVDFIKYTINRTIKY